MNIASLAVESTFVAVESTFVGIESTFVGHRKYLRLGFMNTVFSLPGNIHTDSHTGVRAQWDAFLTHLAQQVVHADE